MTSPNGAVMLGRELRLTIPAAHMTSLSALARVHGWKSQSEFAEALLCDAIETKARNTGFSHFLQVVAGAFCA